MLLNAIIKSFSTLFPLCFHIVFHIKRHVDVVKPLDKAAAGMVTLHIYVLKKNNVRIFLGIY